MLQTEEADGLIKILELASGLAANGSDAVDQFNIDDMVKRLASILGVSVDVINSTEVVQVTRQNRANTNAQAAQIAQAKEVSEINRNNSQAQATASATSGQGI